MKFIFDNKDWLFSGVGVIILAWAFKFFFSKVNKKANSSEKQTNNFEINIENRNESSIAQVKTSALPERAKQAKKLSDWKNETRILFIDDDARFKVAKILTKSGWVHTKLIKDCETLDDTEIVDASILFIDVQGVGVAMGFSDEGLGLALAIKEKYQNKKVIIYSAETNGDRFHEALRKADSFLAKNADPYEFQRIVEEFTIGNGN